MSILSLLYDQWRSKNKNISQSTDFTYDSYDSISQLLLCLPITSLPCFASGNNTFAFPCKNCIKHMVCLVKGK